MSERKKWAIRAISMAAVGLILIIVANLFLGRY
jgi:FtsH-binding integral membrane protein